MEMTSVTASLSRSVGDVVTVGWPWARFYDVTASGMPSPFVGPWRGLMTSQPLGCRLHFLCPKLSLDDVTASSTHVLDIANVHVTPFLYCPLFFTGALFLYISFFDSFISAFFYKLCERGIYVQVIHNSTHFTSHHI